MARIDVHGGDFVKGVGAFHAGSGFVLCDHDGKSESIPLSRLEVADHASEVSLQIYGGGDAMRADLEHVTSESETVGQRVFIAIFADGRLLLASADQTSFEEICAPRGAC
jgi:hypothetical protein